MTATKEQYTRPTLSIAEGNQILTEKAHRPGQVF
jgi:hypothetical protein